MLLGSTGTTVNSRLSSEYWLTTYRLACTRRSESILKGPCEVVSASAPALGASHESTGLAGRSKKSESGPLSTPVARSPALRPLPCRPGLAYSLHGHRGSLRAIRRCACGLPDSLRLVCLLARAVSVSAPSINVAPRRHPAELRADQNGYGLGVDECPGRESGHLRKRIDERAEVFYPAHDRHTLGGGVDIKYVGLEAFV